MVWQMLWLINMVTKVKVYLETREQKGEILADYVTSIIYERDLENDPINNPNKSERLNKIFESMDPEDVANFKEELKELKKA